MADVELVIKMDEEMLKWVNDVNKFGNDYGLSDFIELVKSGTPLPKGHGRLIDESKITKCHMPVNQFDVRGIRTDAPTIVCSDKEEHR